MKRLFWMIFFFVFVLVVAASTNADTIRRYAWPPDGETKISLESIYKAGVGRSSFFVDGIQLWAQDTDLAVAQYLFEVPSYTYGIEVSLRYIAESGTLIKLYIADLEEEDYEDNGFSVVLPAEKDWYKFFVNNLNFSRKVKIEVSVAQGVVDIYYFEINWLSYKPRIEVIHRYREVPLSEEFYIYHYYYERVPLYVYETPYRIIVYDYWWEAPKYTEWYYCYAPTIIKYRPVYRLYRTTPIYYSSYSYRWGRPVVVDCPREDPPPRPRVKTRRSVLSSSAAEKRRSVEVEKEKYLPSASRNEIRSFDAQKFLERRPQKDDEKRFPQSSKLQEFHREVKKESQKIKIRRMSDVLQNPRQERLTEGQREEDISESEGRQPIRQISARDRQEIRRAPKLLSSIDIQRDGGAQREERQIPQKSRRSLENIFSRVVNVKVTTEQNESSQRTNNYVGDSFQKRRVDHQQPIQIQRAPSESSQRTNNYVGESSFQKRRVDVDRQQPIQQIQRAPVREYSQPSVQPSAQPSPQRELRREESRLASSSSSSSSSSSDDEEHKKRRRDR